MRSHWGRWLAGVCFFLAVADRLWSAEPDAPARLARLVERLGDASFTEREAAAAELARLGPSAQVTLIAALTSADVEVRIRARKLLERLAVEDLWDGTHFEPPPHGQTPRALLESLMAQTGNRMLLHERYAELPDRSMFLAPGRRNFWPALDELCGQIDCRFRAHYELLSPGLAIVTGQRGRSPVAYSGPLRAQLTAARRLFQEDLDYATAADERQYSFQLHLDLAWEDRFHLVAHRAQPVLVRAITPAGQHVSSEQPTGGTWQVVSAEAHQTSATLRLHPPPIAADRLTELVLAWELIAVGDPDSIELEPQIDRDTHYQDDAAITVTDCRTDTNGRVEIDLTISRDLPTPDPTEVLVHENRIALLDAAGEAYRQQGQSHAVTQDGAAYKLTFVPPTTGSQPAKLRVTYPRIRSLRALELAFHDVPLPHARPE